MFLPVNVFLTSHGGFLVFLVPDVNGGSHDCPAEEMSFEKG